MAFGFLGHVLQGDSKPGGGVFGFLDKQLLPQSEQDKVNRSPFGANPQATAIKAVANQAHGILQSTAKVVPELLATGSQAVTGQPTTLPAKTSSVGKFVFGDKPIQSIQVKSQGAEQSHPGGFSFLGVHLSPSQTGLAEAGLSTATDAAAFLPPVAKGVKAGVEVGLAHQASIIDKAVPRATIKDQQVLKDFVDYKAGAYNPPLGQVNKILADAREVGARHNIDLINGTKESQINDATSILDQIGKDRKSVSEGGYVQVPGSAPEAPQVHTIESPLGTLRIHQDELNKLSQAKTPAEIKNIIGDVLPQGLTDKLAPALAHTHDPNIIRNIIGRELSPTPLPRPSVGQEITPTTVKPYGEPAGQGSLTSVTENGSPATEEAINKHLQTISNANSTTPELQDAIQGLKQTHDLRNTEKLSEEARKVVEKDYVGSLSEVLSAENPTDKQIALGEHLIVKAQREGNIGQAVNVAEHLDNKLREHGRAIQAASIISRLSPEGRLLAATRKVKRAREASPNADKEGKIAEEIKQNLENSVPGFDRGSVGQAIKDISNDQQKLDLGGLEGGSQAAENTGQKLAKNVEQAATPQVKKKADTLVQELTKKVKQEYLDPKTTVKKPPIDILREVFGRSAEADEAYPLAQKILRDKYANSPQMQEALDKFFGSKLDLPAANTTINRAVADQLKANGEKVSDIIYKSLTTQEATIKNVANDLVKNGFDPQSATKLAEEVAKRLNKQVADAKISTLERLSKDATGKNQDTFLEKVNKLSNLGALTNEDYLHLARARLNLPHLNDASAQKISDLSQKIQELPNGSEKYELIRELHDTINSNIPTTKGELFRQIFAAPKSALASTDISGGGRQGAVLGTRFPKEWGAAEKDSIKSFKSQKFFDDKIAELNTRADMPSEYLALREKAGVAVAGGPDALHEEAFASTLPEKVPGLGRVVGASDRAYTLGLSSLRDRTFEKIYNDYQNVRPMNTWSDKEIQSIGRFINTASGRGDLGKFLETHGKTLQEALFSPKLWKSRLDMLNPYYYYSLKGPARKYAIQSAATFASTAASIMGLAIAAGATVDTDARSSDFLKIKTGDTRFDIMGGLQQNLVFLWREGSGEKKSSQTGKISDLNAGGFGAPTRLSIIADLFQSKENPSIAQITTQIKGQDKSGNPLTPTGRLKNIGSLGVPLSIGDTYNNVQHSDNIAGGLAKSIPGFLGAGVGSYGTQDINVTGNPKKYLDYIKTQGANQQTIDASTKFFQALKSASGTKTNVNAAIDKALAKKDVAKAQDLADTYNKELAKGLTEWSQQYGEQYGNQDLQGAYDHQKINLTPESVNSRIKSIQSTKPF